MSPRFSRMKAFVAPQTGPRRLALVSSAFALIVLSAATAAAAPFQVGIGCDVVYDKGCAEFHRGVRIAAEEAPLMSFIPAGFDSIQVDVPADGALTPAAADGAATATKLTAAAAAALQVAQDLHTGGAKALLGFGPVGLSDVAAWAGANKVALMAPRSLQNYSDTSYGADATVAASAGYTASDLEAAGQVEMTTVALQPPLVDELNALVQFGLRTTLNCINFLYAIETDVPGFVAAANALDARVAGRATVQLSKTGFTRVPVTPATIDSALTNLISTAEMKQTCILMAVRPRTLRLLVEAASASASVTTAVAERLVFLAPSTAAPIGRMALPAGTAVPELYVASIIDSPRAASSALGTHFAAVQQSLAGTVPLPSDLTAEEAAESVNALAGYVAARAIFSIAHQSGDATDVARVSAAAFDLSITGVLDTTLGPLCRSDGGSCLLQSVQACPVGARRTFMNRLNTTTGALDSILDVAPTLDTDPKLRSEAVQDLPFKSCYATADDLAPSLSVPTLYHVPSLDTAYEALCGATRLSSGAVYLVPVAFKYGASMGWGIITRRSVSTAADVVAMATRFQPFLIVGSMAPRSILEAAADLSPLSFASTSIMTSYVDKLPLADDPVTPYDQFREWMLYTDPVLADYVHTAASYATTAAVDGGLGATDLYVIAASTAELDLGVKSVHTFQKELTGTYIATTAAAVLDAMGAIISARRNAAADRTYVVLLIGQDPAWLQAALRRYLEGDSAAVVTFILCAAEELLQRVAVYGLSDDVWVNTVRSVEAGLASTASTARVVANRRADALGAAPRGQAELRAQALQRQAHEGWRSHGSGDDGDADSHGPMGHLRRRARTNLRDANIDVLLQQSADPEVNAGAAREASALLSTPAIDFTVAQDNALVFLFAATLPLFYDTSYYVDYYMSFAEVRELSNSALPSLGLTFLSVAPQKTMSKVLHASGKEAHGVSGVVYGPISATSCNVKNTGDARNPTKPGTLCQCTKLIRRFNIRDFRGFFSRSYDKVLHRYIFPSSDCTVEYKPLAVVEKKMSAAIIAIIAVVVALGVTFTALGLAYYLLRVRGQRDHSDAPKNEEEPFSIVFTGVADSAAIWARAPQAMGPALDMQLDVIRDAARAHHGYEVKTIGDHVMVAFRSRDGDGGATRAVAFALDVQARLWKADWGDVDALDAAYEDVMERAGHRPRLNEEVLWRGLRVAIGVHHGQGRVQRESGGAYDYFGTMVNTAARIQEAANGGQVVCSRDAWAAATIANAPLAAATDLVTLGPTPLRGLPEKVDLVQLLPLDLQKRTFPALHADVRAEEAEDAPLEEDGMILDAPLDDGAVVGVPIKGLQPGVSAAALQMISSSDTTDHEGGSGNEGGMRSGRRTATRRGRKGASTLCSMDVPLALPAAEAHILAAAATPEAAVVYRAYAGFLKGLVSTATPAVRKRVLGILCDAWRVRPADANLLQHMGVGMSVRGADVATSRSRSMSRAQQREDDMFETDCARLAVAIGAARMEAFPGGTKVFLRSTYAELLRI